MVKAVKVRSEVATVNQPESSFYLRMCDNKMHEVALLRQFSIQLSTNRRELTLLGNGR